MDYQPPSGFGAAGAQCAIHPDQTAQSACTRCGNFMCATCTENGTFDACPSCRQLTGDIPGFGHTRDNYSLDGILSFAWERFKKDWVMLSLAALVFMVVVGGANFVVQILQRIGMAIDPIVGAGFSVVGSILQSVIQGVITGGFVVVLHDAFKGRSTDIGRMFGQFKNLGSYAVATMLMVALVFGLMIVVGIAAGIGYVLGRETGAGVGAIIGGVIIIVPAIWLTLPFMFINMEIALGGETRGVQALTNSFRLADGHRLWMFLFYFVSGLITLGGIIACCVGFFPAYALAMMLQLGLYLALRNGSGLPPMRGQI